MTLREKLRGTGGGAADAQQRVFEKFGVIDNPFPPAGQPSGHPHFETRADEKIVAAVGQFERDGHPSQVIVVEGTQGVGKTNLLFHYEKELEDLYRDNAKFWIIRYYPDPEPSFEAIVRRVFQELGASHLAEIGQALAAADEPTRTTVLGHARSQEMRNMLQSLALSVAATNPDEEFAIKETSELALDWLVGLRLLKKHTEALGVQFRLDTVESKTQALRDIVFVSDALGLINGIFLLLDELEKQDYSLSKTPILLYLSAIRALIDALPRHLFLVLALTPDARQRYFAMLPAIAGRLQNIVELKPLESKEDALNLFRFYLAEAERRARELGSEKGWAKGNTPLITDSEAAAIFEDASAQAKEQGTPGVRQRAFLNLLNKRAEDRLAPLFAT